MSELAAIDIWLYARLTGDATLTALLATTVSVYDTRAPQGAARPYVVYAVQDAEDKGGVGGVRILTRAECVVRAVGVADVTVKYGAVQAIADRIDALLHRAAIATNTGGTVLSCVREQPLKGLDNDGDGRVIPWVGGNYVIQAQ
jgi:hypothetical protein